MENIGKYQVGGTTQPANQPAEGSDDWDRLWDGTGEIFPPPEQFPRQLEPLHEALGGGLPGMPGRQDPPIPPQAVTPPQPNRTTYSPQDTNQDGIVSEIERYMAYQQMNPQERQRSWIEQNVWEKGYTVDMATGQILDPEQGAVVGKLPSFE